MVNVAAEAASTYQFDETTLRISLAEIARRSFGNGATVNQALEEDWKQGRRPCHGRRNLDPGRRSQTERVRDRLALDPSAADTTAVTQLERASTDRLTLDARLAAVATSNPESNLEEPTGPLRLPRDQQTSILLQA